MTKPVLFPFSYPRRSHERRHGPDGYENCASFRPWLRDEFTFRCVYCLKRERWGYLKASYDLDHFHAQAIAQAQILDYDNLLYSCATCNSAKGVDPIPDPTTELLDSSVEVHDDGSITASTPGAQKIIEVLGLDDPEYREFRLMMIGIVRITAAHRLTDPTFEMVMGYPSDLPDLNRLRPPRNRRPEGVETSYYARQRRGQLPATY